MADHELDPGFEEVPLDAGFEEVPVENKQHSDLERMIAGEKKPTSNPTPEDKQAMQFNDLMNTGAMELGAAGGLYSFKKLGHAVAPSLVDDPKFAEELERVKAGKRGLEQGITWGALDEVKGAAAAGTKKLMGDERSLSDLYKNYRDVEREANKQAEAQHKGAYTVGEIGGALLGPQSLGIQGAVEAKLGSQSLKAALKSAGVKGVEQMSEQGLLTLAKNLGIKGFGAIGKEIGKRALGSAAEFGVQGAIQSGLGSENTGVELAKDIAHGATFGAIAGGATRAAGEVLPIAAKAAIKSIKPNMDESPMLRQAVQAYQDVEAGAKPVTEGTGAEWAQGVKKSAEDVTEKLTGLENETGKEIDIALKKATEAGKMVNLDKPLQGAAEDLQKIAKIRPEIELDPEYKKVLERLFLTKDTEISPAEARYIKNKFFEFAEGLEEPKLQSTLRQYASNVDDALKTAVPEYETAANKFADIRGAGRETIQSEGMPEKYRQQWISDLKRDKEATYKKVKDLIEGMNIPGAHAADKAATMKQVVQNFQELENKYPGTIKQMGYDSVESMAKDLQLKGDRAAIGKAILGQQPKSSSAGSLTKMVEGVASGGRGLVYSTAQKAGSVVKATKSLYKATANELSSVADKLMGPTASEEAVKAGKALKDAILSNNTQKRNAALFLIQQNPKLRSQIEDVVIGGEDEQQ